MEKEGRKKGGKRRVKKEGRNIEKERVKKEGRKNGKG